MSTLKAKHFHLIEDMDISAGTFSIIERVEGFAIAVGKVIQMWARRSKDRRMLAQMSEHLLEDIGVTRYEVSIEAGKYFWQN